MKTALLVALILHCRPGIPLADAGAYASVVEQRSKVLGVDPVLVVAIGDRESGWQPGAVNKKSGALGIGQILPQFRAPCAGAGGLATAACVAEKKKLLDGVYNLSAMFDAIETWQKFCFKKTGSKEPASWMTSYEGLNNPSKGEWCGWKVTVGAPRRLPIRGPVKQILARQRALRLWLEALPPG